MSRLPTRAPSTRRAVALAVVVVLAAVVGLTAWAIGPWVAAAIAIPVWAARAAVVFFDLALLSCLPYAIGRGR